MTIKLVKLSINDGMEIYHLLRELPEKENGFHNPAYGLTIGEFKEFLHMKKSMSEGHNLKDWQVPETIYWLYIDKEPVGMGKIRHYLTDALRKKGGHISYGIKSNARKKGYGKLMLAELLKEAKNLEIDSALLTCNADNIPSRKVIESNGGRLEKEDDNYCNYWIHIN